MNATAARTAIQNLLTETHAANPRAARKQYPVGKAQATELKALGLYDLMPAGFGFSDAAAVLAAAKDSKTAVFNAYGEGEDVAASNLNQALNS